MASGVVIYIGLLVIASHIPIIFNNIKEIIENHIPTFVKITNWCKSKILKRIRKMFYTNIIFKK